MSAAHTPGPWEAPFLDDGYSSRQGWVTGPDGELIASLDDSNRQEADARLIAAAPTMADYIKRRATEGDAEAAQILESINA